MNCESISIWDNTEDINKFDENKKPTLETYILKGDKKRSSVLICPGGGYQMVSDRESEPVAIRFLAAGYNVFILRYSVHPQKHPQPLYDLTKAISLIRNNEDKFNIDPNKIAVCGFSAGGHLAASLAVHWNKDFSNCQNQINNEIFKPNALILSYPVITSGEYSHAGSFKNLLDDNNFEEGKELMSLENHNGRQTPPTFLWHTFEDDVVPVENSLLFAKSLSFNKIPFELHIFPYGAHGLSLANKEVEDVRHPADPNVSNWIELCIKWLNQEFDLIA